MNLILNNMTQEDKELLLKDLCARLPYGVKVAYNKNVYTVKGLDLIVTDEGDWEYAVTAKGIAPIEIDFFKPYLFPLSSMTEEQQKEANIFDDMDMDILSENLGRNHRNKTNIPTATYNYIDWLNKNHFDYRGLIEKGLAIDATGLNIY